MLWLLRKHKRQITWKGNKGRYKEKGGATGILETVSSLYCCSEGTESGGDSGGCGVGDLLLGIPVMETPAMGTPSMWTLEMGTPAM
jgi:hypothetical protein